MATYMNQVTIIGHLGKAPKMERLTNGKFVTTLSVATGDGYYDANDKWVDQTDWHRVVIWGEHAHKKIDKLGVTKGFTVLIQGRMKYRQYEDKDGIKRSVAEIIVSGPQSRYQFEKNGKAPANAPDDDDNPANEEDREPGQEG